MIDDKATDLTQAWQSKVLLRTGLTRECHATPYRGTSLTKKRPPLGPYNRPMPRAVWLSQGVGVFL